MEQELRKTDSLARTSSTGGGRVRGNVPEPLNYRVGPLALETGATASVAPSSDVRERLGTAAPPRRQPLESRLGRPIDQSQTISQTVSRDIFVRGVGVGLTHTKNLMIKKLKSARETGELEMEGKMLKTTIRTSFSILFDLPNHFSINFVVTDSNFILTERTCSIAITADLSFKTALAADFKREYKNIKFLWKQRPGVGGMTALPPVASQIPGKYLCFFVTKATEKQLVKPENLVLALTRLRDFLVERGVTSLSLPVYDPNRGKLHPRELYALVHVIFSETDIEVYLHKRNLSEHMLEPH